MMESKWIRSEEGAGEKDEEVREGKCGFERVKALGERVCRIQGERKFHHCLCSLCTEQQEQGEHWHFYLSIEFNLCDGRAAIALIFHTRIIPVCPPLCGVHTLHKCVKSVKSLWEEWLSDGSAVCRSILYVLHSASSKSYLCNEHITTNNSGCNFHR